MKCRGPVAVPSPGKFTVQNQRMQLLTERPASRAVVKLQRYCRPSTIWVQGNGHVGNRSVPLPNGDGSIYSDDSESYLVYWYILQQKFDSKCIPKHVREAALLRPVRLFQIRGIEQLPETALPVRHGAFLLSVAAPEEIARVRFRTGRHFAKGFRCIRREFHENRHPVFAR